jgi:hypothetical protein
MTAITSKRKAVTEASALTVDDRIIEREANPGEFGRGRPTKQVPAALRVIFEVANCISSPGIPKQPAEIRLLADLVLSVGVYILTSPTGTGKSVVGASLAALANSTGTPASYLPHFEPRAGSYKQKVGGSVVFTKASAYLSDLRELLTKAVDRTKLVVSDSATLPLKAYSATMPGQSTFPGGMQISDRAFLDEASLMAVNTKTCLVMILNSTLVPYVSDLYGAVEGHITVNGLDTVNVSDRSPQSARRLHTVILPHTFVNATTEAFGYGPYRKQATRVTDRDVRGVNTEIGRTLAIQK